MAEFHRQKKNRIAFRLSDGDFAVVSEAAKLAGLTVPKLAVKRLLDGVLVSRIYPKFSDHEAVKMRLEWQLLRGSVNAIGRNINQMAKHANKGLPVEGLTEFAEALNKLSEAVQQWQL